MASPRINVRVDPELHFKLLSEVETRGWSVSRVANAALEGFLIDTKALDPTDVPKPHPGDTPGVVEAEVVTLYACPVHPAEQRPSPRARCFCNRFTDKPVS